MTKNEFINFIKNELIENNKISNHLKNRYDYDEIVFYLNKYSDQSFKTVNEKIYSLLNNISERPRCKICNNENKFKSFNKGFTKFCSKRCAYQSTERMNKAKRTKLEKYGNENFVNSYKAKKTKLEKYGDENYHNIEKFKQTCLERYGVEFPAQSNEIRNKYKKTMLEKYGVESNFQLEDHINKLKSIDRKSIVEKTKQTNLKRYGVSCALSLNETREKSKKGLIKKYNVDNPWKSKEVHNKIKQTKKENFFNKLKKLKNVSLLFTEEELKTTHYSNKYKWKCKICDTIFYDDLYAGRLPRCPQCYPKHQLTSQYETELYDWLQDLNIKHIIQNDRELIKPKELDLYLPDFNLAIEFNGIYWHSIEYKSKWYHQEKVELCFRRGVRLLYVWENEWLEKKDEVKQYIQYYINNLDEWVKIKKPILLNIKNNLIWF